jgi:hypothetical protein
LKWVETLISGHYEKILQNSGAAFQTLSNDDGRVKEFTKAHNGASDLEALGKLMQGRPEDRMFRLAMLEYQHALYSVAFAQYRQANMSLRLFIELSLGSILFSAHEIDARLWLSGEKDNRWGVITADETGIFSKSFCKAFFEELGEYCEQYQAMAKALYRECSEYVHGNLLSYDGLDGSISINTGALDAWLERADTARLVVKFCLILRYLLHARSDLQNELEDVIMDDFSQISSISAIYREGK